MSRAFFRISLCFCAVVAAQFILLLFSSVTFAAHNILTYKDTITDSKPLAYSNHTLDFTINTSVAAGGYIEVTPPTGFEIIASSTFSERDVELYVNNVLRQSSSTLGANTDQVIITPGSPGSIRYNLNPTTGIPTGAHVQMRIGTVSSAAQKAGFEYSTSTGTTTLIADTAPIRNGTDIGTKFVHMEIGGSALPAYADFTIVVINAISTGRVDTTNMTPPYRYNGAPSGEIGGTTLFVDVSLNTDERAVCKYSQTASTSYLAMTHTFTLTGLIDHSITLPVATGTTNTYYVRCIDEEGNYNTDDYVITFISLPPPTGQPNGSGDVQGDGSGTGNNGAGSGGGNTGSNSGGSGSGGSSSGSGGSGGGSGGVTGQDSSGLSGGGFEPTFGTYPSGDAQVIISGYAFPGSTVYALVDAKVVQSTSASSDGSYSITLNQISRGVYTFGVYAVDPQKVKSTTFSTSFTVTGGKTSSLSNINIMPSISVKPNPVTPGQTLAVSGYAIPNSQVLIENQNSVSSASLKSFTASSDSSGKWLLNIDTTGFSAGTYKIRAKSVQQKNGLTTQTNFSDYTLYGVGQAANGPLTADLNTDGKVNLTDFSILLFWWGGDGGNSNPPADINKDGKVNLTDFSIMLFDWTG